MYVVSAEAEAEASSANHASIDSQPVLDDPAGDARWIRGEEGDRRGSFGSADDMKGALLLTSNHSIRFSGA